MALTVLNGKKTRTTQGSATKEILKNSLSLTEREIIVQPQSMNAFLHADVVLCGLNISLSHEPADFSLLRDDDLNATPSQTKQFAKLIDATDKFYGVEPSLETAERSEFYSEDDQLTEGQKRLMPKNRSQKQISFLTAKIVISNMSNDEGKETTFRSPIVNYYFDTNIRQKPQPI